MLSLVLLSACNPAFSAPAFLPQVASAHSAARGEQASLSMVTLVNPASQYCISVGGSLVIRTRGDGAAYGLCQFTDNRACEEWALFRGNCPVGGIRTTGFDTIAQQYCAWLGGQTLALPRAVCTLPNGTVCPDDALYNGKCPAPALANPIRKTRSSP